MLTIFEKIILGHLIGDYLLQPKKMAIEKSAKGLNGLLWCLAHSLIYTLAICLFAATTNPIIIGLVFLSHFPIDRWSLAGWWLKIIRGRNFLTIEHSRKTDLSFSVVVYVIVDNTIHILLMTLIFSCC